MATLMKFESGASTLQFEAAADYPASRPVALFQVQDRTAAGVLQVEDLGVNVSKRTLAFNLMPKVDYLALIDWFLNVANGGMVSFDFTDERGVVGEVVILDSVIDFPETSFEVYSGRLQLEYV